MTCQKIFSVAKQIERVLLTVAENSIASGQCDEPTIFISRDWRVALLRGRSTRTKLPISNFEITTRVFPRGIPSARRQSHPIERHRYVPRRISSKSSSSYIEDNQPLFVLTESMIQTPFYVARLNWSWNRAEEKTVAEMNWTTLQKSSAILKKGRRFTLYYMGKSSKKFFITKVWYTACFLKWLIDAIRCINFRYLHTVIKVEKQFILLYDKGSFHITRKAFSLQ